MITGRTRHFVNAFGENVIVEEVERAAAEACPRTGAELVEFTVAPVYPDGAGQPAATSGRWSSAPDPSSLAGFARALDEALRALNTDYRTKRAGDVGMAAPRVTPGGRRAASTAGSRAAASSATSTRFPARATSATCSRESSSQPASGSPAASPHRPPANQLIT